MIQNKILIFVFGLLFFILVSEVVYIIYFSTPNNNSLLLKVPKPIYTPIPVKNILTTIPTSGYVNDPKTVELFVNMVKSGFIKSDKEITEYIGTVVNIDNQGGRTPGVGFIYKTKLSLQSANHTTFDLYFAQEDLDKTTVDQIINDKQQPIKLQDLKVGDNIKIEWQRDFTKVINTISQNTISISIMKY